MTGRPARGTATGTPRVALGEPPAGDAAVPDYVVADYTTALGARLRQIRGQQELTLQQVEERSNGRIKAVVLASYERGDRTVSVRRLAQLAEVYGVPVTALLPQDAVTPATAPGSEAAGQVPAPRLVIDLDRLAGIPSPRTEPLARYADSILRERGDYNGRVLTMRRDDVRSLSAIYDTSPHELADRLAEWGVLRSGS